MIGFIHALGDGVPWIAEQARVQFGAQGRYTLDLFHACDYLAAAAPDPTHALGQLRTLRATCSGKIIEEKTDFSSSCTLTLVSPMSASHSACRTSGSPANLDGCSHNTYEP